MLLMLSNSKKSPYRLPTFRITPTPQIFAYATPFGVMGTGHFSIEAQDSMLFHFRPDDITTEFEFVISLMLYVNIEQGSTDDATVDFSMWNPQGGGWGINQGKNKLDWGQNEINIKYPDPYVTRVGDIYISLRNYGSEPVTIEDMNFNLLVRNVDNTESIYSRSP